MPELTARERDDKLPAPRSGNTRNRSTAAAFGVEVPGATARPALGKCLDRKSSPSDEQPAVTGVSSSRDAEPSCGVPGADALDSTPGADALDSVPGADALDSASVRTDRGERGFPESASVGSPLASVSELLAAYFCVWRRNGRG